MLTSGVTSAKGRRAFSGRKRLRPCSSGVFCGGACELRGNRKPEASLSRACSPSIEKSNEFHHQPKALEADIEFRSPANELGAPVTPRCFVF